MTTLGSRPSAEVLLKDTALRNVCRWRLPNSDGENDPKENVAFAKKHGEGFFRQAKAAIGLLASKTDR
jgi:hypothetical protein